MLKTDFLGLKLNNPVMIAAGPWNRDGQSIKESLEAGAGAVVTESIISDTINDVRPRISYDGKGAQNIRLYSDIQIEGWEKEMKIAKSSGGIVIASVSGHTPSEVSYLAGKMERFGADAIELSVSNPAVESLEVVASHAEIIYEMTKEVVSEVDVPVIVKLSQNTTNISKVAKAVKAAGGKGVTAINTVRGILGVDVETAKPSLSTYGGISGEYIRPLGLASVATIAQSVDIPVCGVGGISTSQHVLEYMMLGASAVQVGTNVMLEGKDNIPRIVEDLQRWCQEHHVDNISQIRGNALDNLKSYEEMKFEPSTSKVGGAPCISECNKCVEACMYGAIIRKEGNIDIEEELCNGCGLCTFVCPEEKLKMDL